MRKLLLAVFAVFGGVFLFAQNIYTGQNLEQNRKYWASNRQYYVTFQNDGNLVFSDRSGSSLWDSRTSNKGSRAVFQDDGNLVVYGSGNNVVFSTNTSGRRGDKLTVQDDGNLVIYSGSNPLWSSKSSPYSNNSGSSSRSGSVNTGYQFNRGNKVFSADGRFYITFQRDGNLVLCRSNGDPIWSSRTDNKGSRAEFQNDGNLVVYDSYNRALWSSNTVNRGATKLTVQNDGNLVIYDRYSSAIWSSNSQQ